jgi:enoyl-CoA hydratase
MSYEPIEADSLAKYKALKLDLADGIMTVTLSNPRKKNAVTGDMSGELTTVWEDLSVHPDVKVIVVTGDGNDFCSGVDLSTQNQRFAGARPSSQVNSVTRSARKHVMGILDCEKPTIAKVRGVAYGMGVNMALACDMVFVAEGSRLCDSHVKMGMAAGDGGVLLWPLAVGIHRAKEYLMTGEPVPGDVAERIGLVNRCLPDDELDAHVQSVAEKLRDLPPHAVNYTKMSLNFALKQMTAAAFETSLAYEIYTMGMEDFKEASNAFMEKRKGAFRGV